MTTRSWLAAAACLIALLHASRSVAEPTVELEARGGTRVIGELLLDAVRIKTDLGEFRIESGKLHVIEFGSEFDTVETEKDRLRGRILDGAFLVRTELGDLSIAREKIRSIRFRGTQGPPAAIPAKSASHAQVSAELRPLASVTLKATVRDLLLSRDRSHVFFLNASEGKIQRLRTAERRLDEAAISLGEGNAGLSLSPDGAPLYAFFMPAVHPAPPPAGPPKPAQGRILVIDPVAFRLQGNFEAVCEPSGIAADLGNRLYVCGEKDRHQQLIVLDPTRRVVVRAWESWFGIDRMWLHPDRKRIYGGYGTVNRDGTVYRFHIPADAKGLLQAEHAAAEFTGISSDFLGSPDGRYLICTAGAVLRLAVNGPDDMRSLCQVEPHLAATMDTGVPRLLVSTRDARLLIYSVPEFELLRTVALAGAASHLVLDAKNHQLFAVVQEGTLNERQKVGAGDVKVYDTTPLDLPEASTEPR